MIYNIYEHNSALELCSLQLRLLLILQAEIEFPFCYIKYKDNIASVAIY